MSRRKTRHSTFDTLPQERTKIRSSRYSRYSRYSRAPRVSLKGESEFVIRKSLAQYVTEELEQNGRTLFNQRVYILAKNVVLQPPEAPPPTTLSFSMLGQPKPLPVVVKVDYLKEFQAKLEPILRHCEDVAFTTDTLTGLLLVMGDLYTLIVIEGTEDMVGDCVNELALIANDWWSANRIFLVEDKTDNLLFRNFVFHRSAMIQINEKFPPSTPNDEYVMPREHWSLLQQVNALVDELSQQLSELDDYPDGGLPPDTFNKLLPVVQRMDLVLGSTRFYMTIQQFAKIYGTMPFQVDEDSLLWPHAFNYTPAGVFHRSPFDVNLTFSDYGKEDSKEEHRDSGEVEGSQDEDAREKSVAEEN